MISHKNTRTTLDHRTSDTDQVKSPEARQEGKKYTLDLIEKMRREGLHASVIKSVEDTLQGNTEIYDTLATVQNGAADITFQDKLVLHRGNRTIEVRFMGRANTDGDAVIWLPTEKVVITGDIVVLPTPYGFYSYPRDWAATLGQIRNLGFETLVPGHGPVQKSDAYLTILESMMLDISDQAVAAVENGIDSEEALRGVLDFTAYERAIAGDDPLFQRLFKVWFKDPIATSAFKQANGEPILQFEAEGH